MEYLPVFGVYRFPNGNVYRGEFADGPPDGIGMLQVNAASMSANSRVESSAGEVQSQCLVSAVLGHSAIAHSRSNIVGAIHTTASECLLPRFGVTVL
jgi:hypothetical protein